MEVHVEIDRGNPIVMQWELLRSSERVLNEYPEGDVRLPEPEPADALRLAEELSRGDQVQGWMLTQELASFMLAEVCRLDFEEVVIRSCA